MKALKKHHLTKKDGQNSFLLNGIFVVDFGYRQALFAGGPEVFSAQVPVWALF